MKIKFLCALAAALAAAFVFVQATAGQADSSQKEDFSSLDLTPGELLNYIVSIKLAVIDNDPQDESFPPKFWLQKDAPNSKSLRAITIASHANHLETLIKFRNSEEDTRSPKTWFSKIVESLRAMTSLRLEMEDAIETKRAADYFKVYQKYLERRSEIASIFSERPSLSADELRRIKEANDAARKAPKNQQKKLSPSE